MPIGDYRRVIGIEKQIKARSGYGFPTVFSASCVSIQLIRYTGEN